MPSSRARAALLGDELHDLAEGGLNGFFTAPYGIDPGNNRRKR
jgi:hypothetical protein